MEKSTEMILALKEWYEDRKSTLNNILQYDEIEMEDENGEVINIPKEHIKGFKMGVLTALDFLGEFPVEITKE